MLSANRREKTKNVIKKRLKHIKRDYVDPNKDVRAIQPHRLYKDGLGCKKPSCNVCRDEKHIRANEFIDEEKYE